MTGSYYNAAIYFWDWYAEDKSCTVYNFVSSEIPTVIINSSFMTVTNLVLRIYYLSK